MTRSSPGVRRVVAILNFFADHPGQAFTLTELVRALKLSRATCHALLVGLVEAAYLYRASDKSYVLGPALAAVGQIAHMNFSPLQVAQPEMRALADKFDAVCSAAFREHNEVVVRERAASVSHLGYSVPRGTRLPLRPPFAGIYFAWSRPAEAEAWLDQLEPAPSQIQRDQMRKAMGFLREHGFAFGVRNIADESKLRDTGWLNSDEQASKPVMLEDTLQDDKTYRVGLLNAPVFDGQGGVAFVLALMVLDQTLSGAEVARIGNELRDACNRITSFLVGR